MLSVFRKNQEEPKIVIPATTGRLERTYEQLQKDFGDRLTGRIVDIDISEFIPEFTGPTKLPTKIKDCVCGVLDDYLKEGDEFYFQADERVFGVFLSKANKTVAELKIRVIWNELGRAIEETKQKKQVTIKENCGRVVPNKASHAGGRAWKRGTLPDNLGAKEMRDWASRAMAGMVTNQGFENFRADVEHLSRSLKVQFQPLWYVPNNVICGYVMETTQSFSKVQYLEKQLQEDLAVLATAIRHLKEMAARNEYALLIVPVFIHTICNKNARDLFNIYCHSINPKLKRFLVFRIKGVDTEKMSQSDWDCLNAAAVHCRSVIIEAAKKKIDLEKINDINFHAIGLDISTINASEERLFKLFDDFANLYQKNKRKNTYVLGIETRSLLLAAINSGHHYVSGNAIKSFSNAPKHASFLELEDLYAGERKKKPSNQ